VSGIRPGAGPVWVAPARGTAEADRADAEAAHGTAKAQVANLVAELEAARERERTPPPHARIAPAAAPPNGTPPDPVIAARPTFSGFDHRKRRFRDARKPRRAASRPPRGHSVDVLAMCIAGQDETARRRVEEALRQGRS
jgi:hypothetical protein